MDMNVIKELTWTALKKRMMLSTKTRFGLALIRISTSVHIYLSTVSLPCAAFPALMSCVLIVRVGGRGEREANVDLNHY
jgi:hypothetical protein